jgi:SNF2 family DNA or RNA helicase
MDQPVLTGCLHPFCATCLADLLKSNNNGWGGPPACPICRLTIDPTALSIPATPLDEVELARLEAEKAVQIAKTQAELDALQAFIEQAQNARKNNSITAKNQKHQGQSYEALLKDQERALMSHYQSGIILSSKMRILLSLVEEIIAKNEKVVIFSQFQHSLDYIKKLLLARRITFGYTDGAQQSLRRDKEVTNFTNNPLCSVFVVGYRVGSVGITLNAANHVILCDPCLNRAQEEQACNRIYRLGQQRDVQIHYLISKGTIEEQIYLLNESRRSAELAHSSSDKDKQKKTANKNVNNNNNNNIDIAKLMADPFISHTSTKSTPARQTNITTYTMNSLTSISNMAASRRHHGGDVDDSDDGDDDFFTATDNTISSSSTTTTTSDTLTNIANYFKTKAALSLAKSSLSATFQASNSMNKTSFGFGFGFDVVDLDALEQEENSLKDAFEEEEAEEEEQEQQQQNDKDGDDEPIVTIAKKKSRNRKKKDDNVTLNDNDYIFMFSIIPDESHESYESQEDVAEWVDS